MFGNIPLAKASHSRTQSQSEGKVWVKWCRYREAVNWGLSLLDVISFFFLILATSVLAVLLFISTSTDEAEKTPKFYLVTPPLVFKV